MSAPAPEPPAPAQSPEEQHGGRQPGHVLAQLSAALENPDIRALEWSKEGRGVLVHAELYKEEMEKNKELFPELADFGCVAALQNWLLACGFKLKGAKVNSRVLLLQHPDFQRAHPAAEKPGALGGDTGLSAKPKKKKKRASSLHPPGKAKSQDMLGQKPRLRPLYQYLNLDMPELMHSSAEEKEAPELARPSQDPVALWLGTAPWPEDTRASSVPEISASGTDDGSMEVDVDRMLRHAAYVVPPLFPQYSHVAFCPVSYYSLTHGLVGDHHLAHTNCCGVTGGFFFPGCREPDLSGDRGKGNFSL